MGDSTEAEKGGYLELVKREARYVGLLDINECTPEPIVIGSVYGELITIQNSGTIAHTLEHGGTVITVPVGGTETVVPSDLVEIDEGGEIFAGYKCDGVLSGMFFIGANP